MRSLRQEHYSLDDIGNIFEKGFPEKNMFSVEQGITGRYLIIKPEKSKIKSFGLNKSLIMFFICLGLTRIPQIVI